MFISKCKVVFLWLSLRVIILGLALKYGRKTTARGSEVMGIVLRYKFSRMDESDEKLKAGIMPKLDSYTPEDVNAAHELILWVFRLNRITKLSKAEMQMMNGGFSNWP